MGKGDYVLNETFRVVDPTDSLSDSPRKGSFNAIDDLLWLKNKFSRFLKKFDNRFANTTIQGKNRLCRNRHESILFTPKT